MNFPLDNLTSLENINLFSTPKFKDICFDKDNRNKNDIYNFGSITKNQSMYGSKIQHIKNIENPSKEIYIQNNDNSNNKDENKLKENFSLNSFGSNNGCSDIVTLNKKKIVDIKINTNKKKESNKCNIALISFSDKVENYSFNNDNNLKEKGINCSCSTNKDKAAETNNHLKSENSKNYKESEIKSNTSSNGSNYNSSSFKYNLPLEHDKIPLINDFMIYKNINNAEENNKEEKSSELDNNHFGENIKSNNEYTKNNQLVKENLFLQYQMNNNNTNIDTTRKKVKKSQTQRLCRINKSLSDVYKNNYDTCENSIRNRNTLDKINNNNYKNLIIKKNFLLSYDNNKRNKKIIKAPSNDQINKEKKNIIINPKKKFELFLNQIDLNTNIKDNKLSSNNIEENIKERYSLTIREPKIIYNIPTELRAGTHQNSKGRINNNNNVSNTTNKVKNKNRKFIRSTPLDYYNKTFFNYNHLKKNDNNNYNNNDRIIKETNSLSKNLNLSYKYKNKIQHNFVKPNEINYKRKDNKKHSYHTRNTSNLNSNKLFNGLKNTFKKNELIFKTINYETKDINRKKDNKNTLQTQLKNKPYIKNIIRKTSPLLNKNNSKKNNINEFYKKEINQLKLRNSHRNNYYSNNTNNNDNIIYNTIFIDKNINDKKKYVLQKKYKSNNYINNGNISFFNKFKKFINNDKTTQNLLTLESKNQSTYKLSSNIFSGLNTDRNKDNINNNNNFSSSNVNNKSQINNSNFINANESAINIEDSKYNKIKVNKININKKIQNLSKNKTNSYYKIHKKPKNSCLVNNYKNQNNNNVKIEPNYEIYMRGNSQILNFNKIRNKNNLFEELNNLKDNITQYNLTHNNSKSIITESSYAERNNNSINDNLNIEIVKEQMKDSDANIIAKNQNQNYCKINTRCQNNINKLNERLFINHKPNYKTNIQHFNEEIIKYSILRNNRNNQIINEFSVVLGEEKNKSEIINENKKIINKLDENPILSSENKRTIINVNQYYPRYYIDTHENYKKNN